MSPIGAAGWSLITILSDANEVHPAALVTVKEYVPTASPVIVVLVVDPSIEPGLIVQFPVGKSLKITLPVATAQVGCVITPTVGAAGVGFTVTVTLAVPKHPSVFAIVTV